MTGGLTPRGAGLSPMISSRLRSMIDCEYWRQDVERARSCKTMLLRGEVGRDGWEAAKNELDFDFLEPRAPSRLRSRLPDNERA